MSAAVKNPSEARRARIAEAQRSGAVAFMAQIESGHDPTRNDFATGLIGVIAAAMNDTVEIRRLRGDLAAIAEYVERLEEWHALPWYKRRRLEKPARPPLWVHEFPKAAKVSP